MISWHQTATVVNQKYLETSIRSIFPNEKIYTNEVNELKSPTTNAPLEVDIWIPSLHLCFEFQDIYHYSTAYYFHGPLLSVQARDSLKREQVHKRNESLVIVPYWWTGDTKRLLATIHFQRPDISIETMMNNATSPIPSNPPLLRKNMEVVPKIGELMLASFPEHTFLTSFSGSWWIGEKYDGIRFCWHPEDQVIYSRRGVPLVIPTNLKSGFGKKFMDGEFWSGRGLFQESIRLILPHLQSIFASSKFIAFDIPSLDERNTPFEKRYSTLLSHISPTHPILIVVGRTTCDSPDFILFFLHFILEYGGEGIVLRKYGSVYEEGRTNTLLKMKSETATDEEALVVTSAPSHIKLQLPNGAIFTILNNNSNNNNNNIHKDIKKGEVVTVRSSKHSQYHIPLDPIITSIRTDITWEYVLSNFNISRVKPKKPLFEQFAKDRQFDALVPSNWYHLSTMAQAGRSLLTHALSSAFPHMGVERNKIVNKPSIFWDNKQNLRNYIAGFAKRLGFDPLVSDNWYSLKPSLAMKFNTSPIIRKYYKNITDAIHHLFPEIGLQLKTRHKNKSFIRKLLIEFALRRGIDPLIANSWYNFNFGYKETNPQLRPLLGKYYGNSWVNCLKDIFPDLNLDSSQFHYNYLHRRKKELLTTS